MRTSSSSNILFAPEDRSPCWRRMRENLRRRGQRAVRAGEMEERRALEAQRRGFHGLRRRKLRAVGAWVKGGASMRAMRRRERQSNRGTMRSSNAR